MAAYKGTYFAKTFVLKDKDTGVAIDITDWEFSADLRDRLDTDELLNLTSSNGGFAITSAVDGMFEMRITSAQTAELPVAKLVFDVLRTDETPGPIWLFAGRFSVKQPVTRED